MRQVVIENPVINSPFEEPRRHFRFDDEGLTNELVAGRRLSPPAVNNAGTWGRWTLIEIRDPWNAKKDILGQKD